MLVRGILLFSIVAWLPYGLYCFFQPGALAESAGVVATTPTGTTELRAMYGGVQAAVGALALAALLRPRLASGVLLTLLFLSGGLASTRLVGAWLDGGWSGYTGMGPGFEIVTCVLVLVALGRGGEAREGAVA